ncbi:hypothetical protein [Paenibacillus woosongensis]|uniref:Uncharacterized protein n=1 Tax=Paenibacillus woosongensis TaxID=307580 RepID=A0A7X2Z0Y0_9BACL|nr:hypothetical protein [Paenibacillus woosongensis]MUG44719.1 hypothetical protein [Paenibacillus woosongensis]
MSERLSRMERYGQRRHPKDRHQRSGAARKHPEQHRSSEANSRVLKSNEANSKKPLKETKVSRKPNRQARISAKQGADPVEAARIARRSYTVDPVSRQDAAGADLDITAQELPSRREVYPSQRVKLTKYFFNALLFIFITVMVSLFWWGISESPWGQNNGM